VRDSPVHKARDPEAGLDLSPVCCLKACSGCTPCVMCFCKSVQFAFTTQSTDEEVNAQWPRRGEALATNGA